MTSTYSTQRYGLGFRVRVRVGLELVLGLALGLGLGLALALALAQARELEEETSAVFGSAEELAVRRLPCSISHDIPRGGH